MKAETSLALLALLFIFTPVHAGTVGIPGLPVPIPSRAPEQWTVKIQPGTPATAGTTATAATAGTVGIAAPAGPAPQEVWVSNNTTLTTPVKLGTISSIPKGKRVFHWGPVADVERWQAQKTIDQGELDALLDGYGVVGGGFYFSQSVTDTIYYGPRLLVDDMVENVKSVIPTGFIAVDSNLAHELAKSGIYAIENYNGTDWMNIIDLNALKQLSAPTFQTFAQNTDLSVANFSMLFQFDANAPLNLNDPKLAANPIIVQLKAGTFPTGFGTAVEHPGGTPFFALLRNTAESRIKTTYPQLINTMWKADPFSYNYSDLADPMGLSAISENLQIPISDMVSGSSLTNPIASSQAWSPWLQTTPYLKNLTTALETLDFDDLAAKMAADDPTPWTAYDQPGKPDLATVWQNVTSFGTPYSGLQQMNQSFTGSATLAAYRDFPLIAGGPIQYHGKGYYRVNAHQKAVLESNPLLVTDIVPDPSRPGEFLARHEYPSAETYVKLKPFLSADLVSKLDTAQAAGTLVPGTADFKNLTQSMITELMAKSGSLSSSLAYQVQMAIQPFESDTDVTLRANYLRMNYSPLFTKNPNDAFLMSPFEFSIEVQNGLSQHNRIIQGWSEITRREPNDPHYFSSPDFWAVAQNLQSVGNNPDAVVSEGENYYKNPKNLQQIRQEKLSLFNSNLSNCDKDLIKP